MTYIITEPAPSTTTYIRSGRGGAGNILRASSTTPNTTTTSHRVPSTAPSSTRRFFSGVGGAGNAHEASERPALSLDDEVRRLAAREEHVSERGHCGIGGAGNVYRRKASDASVESDSRSSISSVSSKTKLWARMTGKEY